MSASCPCGMIASLSWKLKRTMLKREFFEAGISLHDASSNWPNARGSAPQNATQCAAFSCRLGFGVFFPLPAAAARPASGAASDSLLFFFCFTLAVPASPASLLLFLAFSAPFLMPPPGFASSADIAPPLPGSALAPSELSLTAFASSPPLSCSSGEGEWPGALLRLLRRTCSMSPLRRISCVSVAL